MAKKDSDDAPGNSALLTPLQSPPRRHNRCYTSGRLRPYSHLISGRSNMGISSVIRCAIYARKSTEQNGVAEANKSVTRQKELAREFATARGWSVAAEFEDDGISGAEFEKRPGFQAMLAAAHRGDFQYLIVAEQKALGRESYRGPVHHQAASTSWCRGVVLHGRQVADAPQRDRQSHGVDARIW